MKIAYCGLFVFSAVVMQIANANQGGAGNATPAAKPLHMGDLVVAKSVTVDDIELSVTAPRVIFRAKVVPIAIVTKNNSKHRLVWFNVSAYSTYKLSITSESGDVVPLTRFGKKTLLSEGKVSGEIKGLERGGTSELRIDLLRFFDLSENGKYKLAIERNVGLELGEVAPGQRKGKSVSLEIRDFPFVVQDDDSVGLFSTGG